jgi:starch phosphorylase
MHLTEHLVQGVDVWLNTPRRPWEACGTSGMKVLINGGINLSELDGWWAEAYQPDVGWALGDSQNHATEQARDSAEAVELLDLLEGEVLPAFYARDEEGIPGAWVERIRQSMARLTPHFSSNRALREYTEQHYLPAAAAYQLRTADKGASSKTVVEWLSKLDRNWDSLRFGEVKVESWGDQHMFEVQVWFDGLDPKDLRVELYADGVMGGTPVRHEMTRDVQKVNPPGLYVYRATVPAVRRADDYTARVVPSRAGVAIPLENAKVSWQR